MTGPDDHQLLVDFARANSEAAFAALVSRHINLVYSTALRSTGNHHAAGEITQAVFIILARKADGFSRKIVLSGWLYQTTRLTAANFLRTEIRRQKREQEAYMQSTLNEPESEAWRQIAPLLDGAMEKLGQKDHDALVLRFFENKNFAEVGASLGASEDAAKMRVNRALEKLRKFFTKRGLTLSSVAIAGAVSANSVQAAPAALAKSVTALAIAKGAAASASTLTLIKGALKIMAWTKAQAAIVGVVIVGLAALSVIQHQVQAKLSEQNESLAQQIAQLQTDNENLSKRIAQAKRTPHLPAPPVQATSSTNGLVEDLQFTNLYTRFKDAAPKLTAAQVEAYLKAYRTNAASLLAAYRTSGDPALLKEAMTNYPNDPQVAFEAALDKDLSPEQKRQWLDTFKKSAPDNALANYLSALNYFNSGQIDQGVQELTAASGKQPDAYTLARAQDDEEAYLSAGYSVAEAERISDSWLELPQLHQVKQLGVDLVDLAKAYNQSGDQASAQAAFQMAISMGQRCADTSNDPMLISQLVGMAIQKIAFNAMDPNSPYGNTGQTVQDQLNQITRNRAAINELVQQATPLLPTMSDQDILNYENRRRALGEMAALQWVVSKYGQQ
jgi:RNA polymerase sigma factor (sigma-70 family)